MIYIVSGFKRSGTSLMMRLLKTLGIPLYYDPDNVHYTVENPYYYESEFVHEGFTEEDKYKLKGKAVKVVSYGLRNVPLGDYKIIYMQRDLDSVFASLEKGSRDMNAEKGSFLYAEMMGFVKKYAPKQVHYVDYDRLIDDPDTTLKELLKFLGFDHEDLSTIKLLKDEIRPELRHHGGNKNG